jgi:pyroglutamyl-peptidase
MPIALVTGFQPFKDYQSNPSQEIAEQLDGCRVGSLTVVSRILPVEWGRDTEILFPAIEEHRPALILSLGLAGSAAHVWVERLAVNLRAAEGGRHAPIVAGGPVGYLATIDPDAVSAAMRAEGVPAQAHVYAGDYLCNHVFYEALHYCATRHPGTRAGFLHLPLSAEQAIAENRLGTPVLPLETMLRGVRAALAACDAPGGP